MSFAVPGARARFVWARRVQIARSANVRAGVKFTTGTGRLRGSDALKSQDGGLAGAAGTADAASPGRYRLALKNSVASEARAFGFSLVVLATAYLTITYHGLPDALGALCYVGGVLAGQTVAAAVAFRGVRETWRSGEQVEYRAPASVHLLSPVCGVLAGWGVGWAIASHALAFAVAGCAAVVVYQFVLAGELALAMTHGQRIHADRDPSTPPGA